MAENRSSEWSTLSASSVSDLTSSQGEDLSLSGNRTRNLTEEPAGNEQNKIDHSLLYWRDRMTTIDVHDMRFRVPRFVLARHSAYFRKAFLEMEEQEVLLIRDPDVTSAAVESLLFLYPLDHGQVPVLNLVQWMGVLHLADKWGFTALYQAAREAIPPLATSVDMIVLGKKYNLDDWLAPAFVDLIARDDSLTLQEGERLCLDIVIAIADGRLRARMIRQVRATREIEVIASKILSKTSYQNLQSSEENASSREDEVSTDSDDAEP